MALQKSNVRLIFLSAFYVFFLLVGAAIFSAIEGPIEQRRLRQLLAVREKFLQNRRDCLSGQFYADPTIWHVILIDYYIFAITYMVYAILLSWLLSFWQIKFSIGLCNRTAKIKETHTENSNR